MKLTIALNAGCRLDKGELDKIIEKSDSSDSSKISQERKTKNSQVEDDEFTSEYSNCNVH